MTARILPAKEWPRLDAFGFADIWPTWTPEDVRVCVVEDEDGQITDHWVAIRFWHVEALHVHHPSAALRLWRIMTRTLKELGASVAWTGALPQDAVTKDFIDRMGGQRLPMDHFVMPVNQEAVCHSSH